MRNLHLNFGGVNALFDVSLNIQEGEIYAIIGPNGAGKTSLLNSISGLYHPQKGEIYFNGKNISRLSSYKRAQLGIARTFQNIELFKGMTTLDNLMLGAHTHIRSGALLGGIYFGPAEKEEIRQRKFIEDIIDFLEIEPIRHEVVGTLSYGFQKRVEIGRALALRPKVILMDEPMAGMNIEEKEDIARFIIDINEEWGMTVVLIEHDMGVVMDISNAVCVLDFGKKIGEGSPEEIRDNPRVIQAYLGEEAVI
ncbi:lipopolysaccharide export system ATP-binding protein LptB [bacterium BMS3Abin05]|nr:lipopolysaccharide export system ATP-binding protein LptB [bacterium BMS3Abin05]GBE28361.1 lipopolysaccharide export system ATP-binding protein LptB [bacterium BMS3Bbin03]